MAQERAVVTAEDHAAALAVLEDWLQRHGAPGAQRATSGAQLELVGMIAATRADAREARLARLRPILLGRMAEQDARRRRHVNDAAEHVEADSLRLAAKLLHDAAAAQEVQEQLQRILDGLIQ